MTNREYVNRLMTLPGDVARQAYTTGINACILLVKVRPYGDEDRALIGRMRLLLPSRVPTGGGNG